MFMFLNRDKLYQIDGDMEMNCEINWGRNIVALDERDGVYIFYYCNKID